MSILGGTGISASSASMEETYDVIVIGGGHAGTEAAVGAVRAGSSKGLRVALITGALEQIGQLSCNPAIGGIAKGTVVREVDALGGIIARATDMASVQFRMLNRGKGPAVWAPRAQCDRGLYRRAVRSLLEEHPRLVTIQGMVARLLFDESGNRIAGVETLEGRRFGARAVVLTTGTFGRGKMHIGTATRIGGGRAGEAPSTVLCDQLDAIGLVTERFKTGTPPRIDGRSVIFDALEVQESEMEQFDYSWSHFWTTPRRTGPIMSSASDQPADTARTGDVAVSRTRHPDQMKCWITWLEGAGKEIIAHHIEESAMYGGAIASRGPRYCPSVEDKVVKFPNAERHQIFLEPEGHDTSEMYVNGLSTSLPSQVQLAVLRTIRGLENVRMTRAGYAIEYDYYPPTQLHSTLASRAVEGLWFAGQVNGTTGYEEAAGQGVLAGINAARWSADLSPMILGRETSYIGVLVDDLVTKGVDEPYRLFTSRSEFRLTVRQDNALARLSPLAAEFGLYVQGEGEMAAVQLEEVVAVRKLAAATSITPLEAAQVLDSVGSPPLAYAVRVEELAGRQKLSLSALFGAAGVGEQFSQTALASAELEIKYSSYFDKERLRANRMRTLGHMKLPTDFDYGCLHTLSMEARQKLSVLRPATLAQAGGIPGISPADMQNLVFELRRQKIV